MILSNQMQERLKVLLAEAPLLEGEMRRVEGMGDLYVALSKEQDKPYYFQYSLAIEGVPHFFFGRGE